MTPRRSTANWVNCDVMIRGLQQVVGSVFSSFAHLPCGYSYGYFIRARSDRFTAPLHTQLLRQSAMDVGRAACDIENTRRLHFSTKYTVTSVNLREAIANSFLLFLMYAISIVSFQLERLDSRSGKTLSKWYLYHFRVFGLISNRILLKLCSLNKLDNYGQC